MFVFFLFFLREISEQLCSDIYLLVNTDCAQALDGEMQCYRDTFTQSIAKKWKVNMDSAL